MQITKDAKLLGYATLGQHINAEGGKTVEMRMEVNRNSGAPLKLHQLSIYDSTGHPQRMVLEIVGSERTETIAAFDGAGARVSKMVHGLAKNSRVNRAANAPWGDASEFWFLRDHPKKGDHFMTLHFSMDRLDWELTEITYLGMREVTVGSKKVQANAVQSDTEGRFSTAYLDEVGNPIRLETDGGVTMAVIASGAKKSGPNG